MVKHIADRLHREGPKRMLALDGGGVRGIISIAFLKEIEKILGERFTEQGYYNDPSEFRLAHYYDMIGGTSVGSMIATQIAWGESMYDIERRFKISAPKIFKKGKANEWFGTLADKWNQAFSTQYKASTVRGAVWGVVGNETIGSKRLKTGLTIITKRVDTGSVWALNNNPAGRFYKVNHHYPLPDLVRASTAAPTYFAPKNIGIFGAKFEEIDGLFVDGGISPHNNPALKLLLMAGIRGYNLGGGTREEPKSWKLGHKNLLITSIGTGSYEHNVGSINNALDAANALQGMISDGQELALTILQWLSSPRNAWTIDRMYGDLAKDNLGEVFGSPDGALSFHRYDMLLEEKWLKNELGLTVPSGKLSLYKDFTNTKGIQPLLEIATAAAQKQVDGMDFPDDFDGNLSLDKTEPKDDIAEQNKQAETQSA